MNTYLILVLLVFSHVGHSMDTFRAQKPDNSQIDFDINNLLDKDLAELNVMFDLGEELDFDKSPQPQESTQKNLEYQWDLPLSSRDFTGHSPAKHFKLSQNKNEQVVTNAPAQKDYTADTMQKQIPPKPAAVQKKEKMPVIDQSLIYNFIAKKHPRKPRQPSEKKSPYVRMDFKTLASNNYEIKSCPICLKLISYINGNKSLISHINSSLNCSQVVGRIPCDECRMEAIRSGQKAIFLSSCCIINRLSKILGRNDLVNCTPEESSLLVAVLLAKKELHTNKHEKPTQSDIQMDTTTPKKITIWKNTNESLENSNFTCLLCNKTYANNYFLGNHARYKHSHLRLSKQRWQCPLCSDVASQFYILMGHIEQMHPEDTQIQWIDCNPTK